MSTIHEPALDGTGEPDPPPPQPTRAELTGRKAAALARYGGMVLLVFAVMVACLYVVTAGDAARAVSGLLLGAAITLAVLGGGSLIGAWGVRVVVTEVHRVGCRLRREISEQVAARIATCAQLVGAELAGLHGGVIRRLDSLERRVDEKDEEFERGWVEGAAKAAGAVAGNGNVRSIGPTHPAR
jgi:hypothetical protein